MVCEGGREALALLQDDHAFDLILCDLAMREVSGIDVWRALRKTGDDGKIVFMTGGTTGSEAAEFLASVENPCLEKPFPPEQLRQLLRNHSCD